MNEGQHRRGRGEGSITKRADGRWEARLDLGYVNGRRRYKALYGRTRKGVSEQLHQAKQSQAEGTLVTDERMTVGKWLDHWMDVVLANRVANGTLEEVTRNHYSDVVRLHLKPVLGQHRLSKLTPAHIDGLIALRRERYSPNSLRIMRTTLRKSLRDARKNGFFVPSAAIDLSEPVSVPRRAKSWLDEAAARQLLASIEGDRLEALYVTTLSLGLRRGEALALQWSDIDFAKRTVRVHRSLKRVTNRPLMDGSFPGGQRTRLVVGEPKTEGSSRTQPLPDRIVEVLRRHEIRQKEERLAAGATWSHTDFVFTTPIGTAIDPDNVSHYFSTACKRAGLGHRNLHQLRHSAASILLAQGVPLHEVSRFLGHSTISVTMDVYGHLAEEGLRAAARAMNEALWGGSATS
jgi:integrase